MKTAAERYDEAEAKAKDYHATNYIWGGPCPSLPILLRQYRIAAIEAAVAEVRARCVAIARRRSNHSGLHPIEDVAWQIAEEIEHEDRNTALR